MRIACLQFAPRVGGTDLNIERADAVLERADPQDIDLLVLPELAFSGYNFRSLHEISPHLEPGENGISAAWSRQAALKYNCVVVTGYPERVDSEESRRLGPEHYNSAMIMNGDGDVVGNYRKSHLYYTDETWALEGGRGFYAGRVHGLGQMAVGICMDINPYKFEASWEAYEFSSHVLETGARLVVLSMAWCTHADQHEFFCNPGEPDMDSLLYWITRLQPIISIDSDQEIIIVFGNRCGAEGETTYVGTSTVLGIKSGEILLYGILGRNEESLLVVDTDAPPYARLKLKSQEPALAQDQAEDTWEPQVRPAQGTSDQQRNETDSGMRSTYGTGIHHASPSGSPEYTLDTVMMTKEQEEHSTHDHHGSKPSCRHREYHTRRNSPVDGNSVVPDAGGTDASGKREPRQGLSKGTVAPPAPTPSRSDIGYTRLTQLHVDAPATRKHGICNMRPAMSEGGSDKDCMDELTESEEASILSGSSSESEAEGWPRAQQSQIYGYGQPRGAASNSAGKPYPIARCSQDGLPNPQPEQNGTCDFDLVQMISAFALDNEIVPSSNTENFKEEDIYKYVHGKNLTSEHHIRYHTHLLRERRVRQGFPADVEEDEDDQDIDVGAEEEDIVFEARPDLNAPRHGRGIDAQSSNSYQQMFETRQTFWLEHSAEPTPIADTPMSYMTQFSPTRARIHLERRAPTLTTVNSGQMRQQSQVRHAQGLAPGPKTGDPLVDEIRIAIAPELASKDGGENGTCFDRVPALSRTRPTEASLSLKDPSRRPKAAARQLPPLRLMPREVPKENWMGREVRERSRRMLQRVASAQEAALPQSREQGGDKDRKTPVPMVLVYEGEGEHA